MVTKKGSVKTKPTFEAVESYPESHAIGPDDAEITFEGENVVGMVDHLFSDTSKLKKYATGKKLTKLEQEVAKKKIDKVTKINNDTSAQIDLLPDFEPYASGGRVPFKKGKNEWLQLLEIDWDDMDPDEWVGILRSLGVKGHASGGRVPLGKGKLVSPKGLAALIEKLFPGTTKVGQTSKTMAPKTELRRELADFLERNPQFKNKITAHSGDVAKAGEGRFTKAEVLRQMFENTIKQNKSANTKKRFTNFMKEIESKPELANEPDVWNFFTGKLPENQKLVVYGDDTVDFWRQSDFGPHNIKTTEKFMQKHPHLTRDQAVKIQNMEPEDQIFEMKKIEASRKKNMHAEGGIAGGRVGMLFGGGVYRTIIKNLAKARGVTPSDYLKITNYKALPKEVKKYMSEADFNKMKAGRIEMFENWVNMAQTRKSFMENIKQGKKNEFAAPIFEHLEKSFKSPVPSGVTDKDILQGEFILKNLKTKGRKLNASGGLAGMLGE